MAGFVGTRMHHELIDKIRKLLERTPERPILILIDGPAGAGKSTLASEITREIGFGEIIHCDDLYNGWEDALTPTLEKTIHSWIITPLKSGRTPRYRKFNWTTSKYGEEITLPTTPMIILEGVGCAMSSICESADLAIWMDIPYEIGFNRVIARDGSAISKEMKLWLDRQRTFFSAHHNRENCTLHLGYGEPT